MYQEMAKHITAATTTIDYAPAAASEIDRVLNVMMLELRPVYIGISTDIAYEVISDAPLTSPICTMLPPNMPELKRTVVAGIRAELDKAKFPIIIVDGGKTCPRLFNTKLLN
jgi:pyruvate decarboxylase